MKIVVAIKQVPARDSELRIALRESGSKKPTSPTRSMSRTLTLSKPACNSRKSTAAKWWRCAPARRALPDHSGSSGQGRDRAIHIEDDLAHSIRWPPRACWPRRCAEKPDLVLTGLQSDDLGYGQTGVILAELLGLPHATIVMQVEKQDGGIRVKRELEDGWFQHVEMPLPACSPFNPASASCATPR
jgi:electron transfer flavoprotein beta subunit